MAATPVQEEVEEEEEEEDNEEGADADETNRGVNTSTVRQC